MKQRLTLRGKLLCFCGKRVWLVGRLPAAGLVRLGGHDELEGASLEEVIVGDVEFLELNAVAQYLLDIAVRVAHAIGLHLKGLAVRKGDTGVRKVRSAEHVLVASGADRIESKHAEDVPTDI